jgi:hypothetical protein
MIRTRLSFIVSVLAFGVLASAASAQEDAKALITKMKATLEPAKSSARTVKLTVTGDGSSSEVVLGQARGAVGGGKQILTVVLAPADSAAPRTSCRKAPRATTTGSGCTSRRSAASRRRVARGVLRVPQLGLHVLRPGLREPAPKYSP